MHVLRVLLREMGSEVIRYLICGHKRGQPMSLIVSVSSSLY